MRKLLFGVLILPALAAVLTVPGSADAIAIAMPVKPGANRVALNDAIVVGRVMGVEDMDIKVPIAPNVQGEITWRIAVVGVTEIVKGKKEFKQVRVGFQPVGNVNGPGPVGGPIGGPIGRPGFGSPQLQTGQDGLFYLTKHPTADFYTVQNQFDFVPSQNKQQFDADIADAKRASKLLENAMESLKSTDAKDRYLTAAMLITQYRTPKGQNPKTELVSVEESKLILLALAEADWTVKNMPGPGGPAVKGSPVRPGFNYDPLAPLNMFGMLGVSQKDGFTPPTKMNNPQDYPNACRDWCKQNAGKYQIQRFVSN